MSYPLQLTALGVLGGAAFESRLHPKQKALTDLKTSECREPNDIRSHEPFDRS